MCVFMKGLTTAAQLKKNGPVHIGLPIPYTGDPTDKKQYMPLSYEYLGTI